jgi:hypothetical protein
MSHKNPYSIIKESPVDINKSINAKNNEITVTTKNTDKNALLTCSFVGKITFVISSFDTLK